jgi:3-methyl-2-oxobutanoate hydroxymethyltransferase
VTESVSVPTIGCGAGPYCDGQVLVINDLLSLPTGLGKTPKFVRSYASLSKSIKEATERFIDDVRRGDYPKLEESFEDESN